MRKWKDNIKMDLKEIVYEGMDWLHLAQDAVQWHGLVNMYWTSDFIKIRHFLLVWVTVNFQEGLSYGIC
jgi:hypothetical protein